VGLFRRKREPESQPQGSGIESFEDGKVPWAADRESIGQPVQGAGQVMPSFDIAGLGGMGALFEQMQQAQAGITIDISHSQHSIDTSNTELGEQIKDVMRKYGIDPETGATGNVDPSRMIAMQQEMMQLIAQHQSGQSGTT
jgi:hypothetical protein